MNNKDYIDKVLNQLLKETEIDMEEELVYFQYIPSNTMSPLPYSNSIYSLTQPFNMPYLFRVYCKNDYGLTDLEIQNLWKEYKRRLLDIIRSNYPHKKYKQF